MDNHILLLKLFQMISVNFYGSSHISDRHGLQSALAAGFEKMDGVFRTKFELKTLFNVPGGTYYNSNMLGRFVQMSSQLATHNEYKGQINVDILGEKRIILIYKHYFID